MSTRKHCAGVTADDLDQLAVALGLRTEWGAWRLSRDGSPLNHRSGAPYDLAQCNDAASVLNVMLFVAGWGAKDLYDFVRALTELLDLSSVRRGKHIDAADILKARADRAATALTRIRAEREPSKRRRVRDHHVSN